MLENMMHVGAYVIHGESDGTISCESDRKNTAKLKELGYDVVYVEIPGGPHEPFQKETPKVIEYFNKHARNPWPKKFVYSSREAKPVRAYWVEVVKASGPVRIEAKVEEGNKISIVCSGAEEIALHLCDDLADLDKPVAVSLNGAEAHNAAVPRTLEEIVLDFRRNRDQNSAACACLRMNPK